jgi:NADP-dependent 3-hydroxy acid dehydrogenase YdfG
MEAKKIVFITGSTAGIGEACAYKFANQGFSLILNGRDIRKLEALKKDLVEKYNSNVFLLPFDVRDRETVRKAIEDLPEKWQAINVLINNAGLVLGVDK